MACITGGSADLRIVLLGKTGAGKSRTGDTILGEKLFTTSYANSCYGISDTVTCKAETRTVDGRRITVIDTPGYLCTERPDEALRAEIDNLIIQCSPGPHAFLIVLAMGTQTAEEKKVVEEILKMFGDGALKYAVVLFTHADQLDDNVTIQQFVVENEHLNKLVQKCGNRIFVIDNHYWNNRIAGCSDETRNSKEIKSLLNTIDQMVEQNGYYTNEMLQAVAQAIEEERANIREETEVQFLEVTVNKRAKSKRFAVALTGFLRDTFLGIAVRLSAKTPISSHAVVVAGAGAEGAAAASADTGIGLGAEGVAAASADTGIGLGAEGVAVISAATGIGLGAEGAAAASADTGIGLGAEGAAVATGIGLGAEGAAAASADTGIGLGAEGVAVASADTGIGLGAEGVAAASAATGIGLGAEGAAAASADTGIGLGAADDQMVKWNRGKHYTNEMPQAVAQANEPDLRIVLLGKTGAGKSSTGNTILREKLFTTACSGDFATATCEAETKTVNGREITVIDTPGYCCTERPDEELRTEIVKCIIECDPGPHAFLIVLFVGRQTAEEKKVVDDILKMFGEEALKYAVVLFTMGDQLGDDQTIQQFVDKNRHLKTLVETCGDRLHVIDNKHWNNPIAGCGDEKRNSKEIKSLLNTIDQMVKQNGGKHYTNEMLQAVAQAIEEERVNIREATEGKLPEIAVTKIAKENVRKRFLINAAGVSTGTLMGALLGVVVCVSAALALVSTGGVAAGVVVAVGACGGAIAGGITGKKAANKAETPEEAAEGALHSIAKKGKNFLKNTMKI